MFGQPAKMPALTKGEDFRVFAARQQAVILEQNARLRNDKAFEDELRSKFSAQ
jgi:hypothetical protein